MKKISITILALFLLTVIKAQTHDTIKSNQADNSLVFVAVEHEPEFPGGIEKMLIIIQKNIHYSAEDFNKYGFQSRHLIQFIINRDGSMSDIKISTIKDGRILISDPNSVLSKEITSTIKSLPRWKPAIQNGHTVRYRCNLPLILEPGSE